MMSSATSAANLEFSCTGLLILCLSLMLLTATTALAREQSDAPDIEILGFSADGRYFAYEQYGYDLAAGALDAAIFVVDRQTNKQAKGFPFGFIATETDKAAPKLSAFGISA